MKEKPNDTSHDLIVKYLLGEASSSEMEAVEEWLQQSEENREYFDQLKKIWTESKLLTPQIQVNENEAWDRFQQRQREQAPVISHVSKKFNWLQAAAILVFIVGAAMLSYYLVGPSSDQLIAAQDRVITHMLPDGSQVVLNKNASITYSKKFGVKSRLVSLKGEGFFTVSPDDSKPFIIDVDDVSVKVIGTSFNIKNTETQTEVVVESGVVNVSKNNHSVQLKQQERAIVAKHSDAPEKIVNSSLLYNYYRTNEFVCNATPLKDLVSVLNDAYHANIKIADSKVAHYPLTTTFQHQSLDNILDVISKTFDLQIERKNGEIILK